MSMFMREPFRVTGPIPSRPEEKACGSKEFKFPLSRFPLRGQAGVGRVPPTPPAGCLPARGDTGVKPERDDAR